MLHTAELTKAKSAGPNNIADFLTMAAWAVHSTFYTTLKASLGVAIFGQDMLFTITFLADWNKIGEHRQCQTDCKTVQDNKSWMDQDYQVSDKILARKDGMFHKSELMEGEPWDL